MQDFYEPKVGELAPEFRLPSTDGKEVSIKDFKGKNLILYFYPKD
ncbi:MAG TPA: redoxin domain-containing protein, partial [Thermoanaerobaculia bacterium]|nr:redoxin domain-containing protein [Thermoanaerobaculia bacterium]